MTGLNIGTGTYFGSGVVSAGSGYSGSAYSQTVTSAKLNQMSRNAAANYSLQMETIQNYLENGKVEKALELYEELFDDIQTTSAMGNITLNDSQVATIASNAYAGNTGSSIVTSVKENTCGSFMTGLKQSIPIFGLFCNGTSEAEAMAQLTGTEVSTKDKVLEFLGMAVGTAAFWALGGWVGSVAKVATGATKISKLGKVAKALHVGKAGKAVKCAIKGKNALKTATKIVGAAATASGVASSVSTGYNAFEEITGEILI